MQVEGKTSRKGTKQNQIYTVTGQNKNPKFYSATTSTGKPVTIYNVHGDWSKIGIMTESMRMSYTINFTIDHEAV